MIKFVFMVVEKSSNINFHENPSYEMRVSPCGQTDGYDAVNSRFPNLAKALNNDSKYQK